MGTEVSVFFFLNVSYSPQTMEEGGHDWWRGDLRREDMIWWRGDLRREDMIGGEVI